MPDKSPRFSRRVKLSVRTGVWIAVLVLSACGGASERWVKSGATEDNIAHDIEQCKFYAEAISTAEAGATYEVYISAGGAPIVVPGAESLRYTRQRSEFVACMTSREYHLSTN